MVWGASAPCNNWRLLNNMKKIISMFLTVAVAGVLVAGCSKPEEGDAAGATKPGATAPDAKAPDAPAADGKMDEKKPDAPAAGGDAKPEDKKTDAPADGKMDDKKSDAPAPAPEDKK